MKSKKIKKYYINEVRLPESSWDIMCIGLFDNNSWDGEGNFCGWYGAEYYKNATLLAHYTIKNPHSYQPKGQNHLKNIIDNKFFKKVYIGSSYWEKILEAENDNIAIKKFFNEEF